MTARLAIAAKSFYPYLPAILPALAAAPLGLYCGLFWGLGVFLLAAISGLICKDLLDRPEKGRGRDWLLDERWLQAQKLAAIGQLSAGVAHEINNPLAIIRQEAQWMQTLLKGPHFQGLEEAKELRDSAGEIVQQVDRCKAITHNLLDFARKRPPVIQAVGVNLLVEDMARLVEKEARQKKIEINKDLAPDLPLIQADAPQLRQVLLNILNNATSAIGNDGTITVTTRKAGPDWLEIVISDTGPGISPEDLPRIFDPFFTTKPPGQGTGLGLSICHGIVEKLGGRLTASSKPGHGAAFTIRVPVKPKRRPRGDDS
jgi:two-component system NtrC family sensor kinase